MSDIKQKREAVLEKIYDELLDGGLDEFKSTAGTGFGNDAKKAQNPKVQLIVALENAAIAEGELELKSEELEFNNAHHQIDKEEHEKEERAKLIANAAVSLVTSALWAVIFVHELRQTRLFEVNGTETSAAGKWLKQAFPKMRVL